MKKNQYWKLQDANVEKEKKRVYDKERKKTTKEK